MTVRYCIGGAGARERTTNKCTYENRENHQRDKKAEGSQKVNAETGALRALRHGIQREIVHYLQSLLK